jgi:hypothetical protein
MTLHLSVTGTSELEEGNVFCPVKKELTQLFLGHSTDGMEAYACAACYEPEPAIREMTQANFDAIVNQLDTSE